MNRPYLLIAVIVAALLFVLFGLVSTKPVRMDTPLVQQNVPITNHAVEPNISCILGIEIAAARDTANKVLTIGINGRPERNAQGGPVVPRYPRVIVCTVFGE